MTELVPGVDAGLIKALDSSLLDGDLAKLALKLTHGYTNPESKPMARFGVVVATEDDKGSSRGAAIKIQEAFREYQRRKLGKDFPDLTHRGLPNRDHIRSAIREFDPGELRAQFGRDAWNIFGRARHVRSQFARGVDVIFDPTEVGHMGQAMQAWTGFRDGVRTFEKVRPSLTTNVAREVQPLVNRNNEAGSPVGNVYHHTWVRSVGTANLFALDHFRVNPASPKAPNLLVAESLKVIPRIGRVRLRIGDRGLADTECVRLCQESVQKHGGGYVLRIPDLRTLKDFNWRKAKEMNYESYERSLTFRTAWHWLNGDFKQVKDDGRDQENHFFFVDNIPTSVDGGVKSDILFHVIAKKNAKGEWEPDWDAAGAVMWFWVDRPLDSGTAGLYRNAYLNRMGAETGFRNEKQNFSTTYSWNQSKRDTMWALGVLLASAWAFQRVHQRDLETMGLKVQETENLDLKRFLVRLVQQVLAEAWPAD
jgi:hypothetical protein